MESVSLKDLKTYLKKVRDLEAIKYKQESYIDYLNRKLNEAKAPSMYVFERYDGRFLDNQYEKEKPDVSDYELGAGIGFAIGLILGLTCSGSFFGGLAMILGGPIIGLIIVACRASSVKDDYNTKVEQEKNRIQEINSKIQKRNDQIAYACEKQKPIIIEELKLAKNEYKKMCALLRQFYDAGIVYSKYRNLVPVTMFCEYIESGLCDGLTGPNGAYRLYEEHIRMDRIIVQLDTVIARLNEIRDNQYMLANLISECQNELVSLKGAVNRQVDALQSIDSNTRMAAYHAQVAADNSEFQKWYTIFQHSYQ